jgi:hypothetical protein
VGPMLMTGLACAGALVALALIATSTTPSTEGPGAPPVKSLFPFSFAWATRGARRADRPRALATILMAYTMGLSVLGVIVGLLGIFLVEGAHEPSAGLWAVGPPIVAAVVAARSLVGHRRTARREVLVTAAFYSFGVLDLSFVVALLGVFIIGHGSNSPPDWPFLILGTASGLASVALGRSGARALMSMAGVDDEQAKAILGAALIRGIGFQTVGVVASAIGIVLIVIS